jgi:hypothetical protein
LRAPGTPPVHQVGIVVASCEKAVQQYSSFFGFTQWRRSTFGPEDVERMTLRGSSPAPGRRQIDDRSRVCR